MVGGIDGVTMGEEAEGEGGEDLVLVKTSPRGLSNHHVGYLDKTHQTLNFSAQCHAGKDICGEAPYGHIERTSGGGAIAAVQVVIVKDRYLPLLPKVTTNQSKLECTNGIHKLKLSPSWLVEAIVRRCEALTVVGSIVLRFRGGAFGLHRVVCRVSNHNKVGDSRFEGCERVRYTGSNSYNSES
ncbi:hypothetical protein LR48_Vigan03g120600 [Vigna angularis]|uniref:Uncharacterized protein n=1 Tax=Phaseolus angularis TaxID=3914 RepID=A0A0L9U5X3_PHAAN|nr:hypothetical protein LR48_Vigan03g120600 [Vigna angularis]